MALRKRFGILVSAGLLASTLLSGCGGSSTNTTIPTTTTLIYAHSAAFKNTSTNQLLFTWGYNAFGQLGNGTLNNTSAAASVTGLGPVAGFAVGGNHTIAYVTTAFNNVSSVMTWGSNNHGQLGEPTLAVTGTGAFRSLPGKVNLTGVVTSVAAGTYHSLAVVDGKIKSWGYNGFGQLGDTTFVDKNTPTPVLVDANGASLPLNFTKVAAAGTHSLALTATGTVFAWGSNASGQLGFNPANLDGSSANRPTLIQVPSAPGVANSPLVTLTNVMQIAAGGSTSYALESPVVTVSADPVPVTTVTQRLWAWGLNGTGQLGTLPVGGNESEFSFTPVLVTIPSPLLTSKTGSIVSISVGLDHALALLSDGSVWAWGFNGFGQLGNNAIIDSIPVQVVGPLGIGTLSGVTQIVASGNSSLARSNGIWYGWGDNSFGQLGNPVSTTTIGYFKSPVPVQGF
jgi:alpha-tubulin suppressor-like RCC1 family protein